ncbi:ATP-dependent sacrificial sulfur transferase LarE [Cloacibacillus evryensis]|uniref:ATP-dependent sacrificial sulfur transferase LarE n=1 Tax=Cloacibacillus evryensis TaxID=508460 RepID=UPI00044F90C7|nr:ATP-dependent sacrificial sulfur transferase LarE [Cloacibacillus evryensis]EXG78214.1 TIGR00268 family protein [Cloacibacillus evryensis DSM 19522]MEA5034769.1 ATP-dependent sacrificial sulfur transferase LarE [Cloacibacillus evryensis]
MELNDFFKENTRAALAFSGGTDSAYLLYMALKCGAQVRPYYVKTPFQPRFELDDALRLARELGTELTVIEYDILDDGLIAANPADRCYHCKKKLFGLLLRERAANDGFPLIIDGTNASDEAGERPGMRALCELGVRSPLRECGLTKTEIRARSRTAGLFTWDKPAYACLATRVPAGRRIDRELLQRVEAAERELFALGFTDFRVRVFHEAARIQLSPEQMAEALKRREDILARLKKYFDIVLLDMETR